LRRKATITSPATEDIDVDPSIFRRKHRSPLDRVQQAFRRRSLKLDTDSVDGRDIAMATKRVSAPVFAGQGEVLLLTGFFFWLVWL